MGTTNIKPLLKWSGGKRKLADIIVSQLVRQATVQEKHTYFEPFAGGLAVFCALYNEGLVDRAVLNDLNPELVALYQATKNNPEALVQALSELPTKGITTEAYLSVREAFNEGDLLSEERAAALLWLNKTGFNGLHRVNKKGKYNVPYSKRTELTSLPTADEVFAFSEALKNATLTSEDFEQTLSKASEGDWVYIDPPYMPESYEKGAAKIFTAYTKEGFGLGDHERLASAMEEASQRRVHIVASNSRSSLVPKIYSKQRGFAIVELEHLHTIGGMDRIKNNEVLILG